MPCMMAFPSQAILAPNARNPVFLCLNQLRRNQLNHFAWTNEETVVQLRGMGPWGMTYVNSEDDPRQMTCERSASGLRSMPAALG